MSFDGSRAETDDTAIFYFHSGSIFEIGVKILNGCAYGSAAVQNSWVFIGGLTDWSWGLTVTDTVRGTYKQYWNPYNQITQTTEDYSAFSCN